MTEFNEPRDESIGRDAAALTDGQATHTLRALPAAAQQTLGAVLNSATRVAIIATDPVGIISVFNSGAERMLGYAAAEMIDKKTPLSFHLAAEVEQHGRVLSQRFGRSVRGFDVFVEHALQGGFEARDWTYVRKDGSHVPVELVITALYDKVGRFGGFLGVATDISERKRALQESRDRLESILSSIEDVIYSIDPTTEDVLHVNRAAEVVYGREPAQFVADARLRARVIHSLDRERITRAWAQALAERGALDVEYRIVRPDGSVRWVHDRARPIKDAHGSVMRYDGIVTDVTGRKQAAQAMIDSANRIGAVLDNVVEGVVTINESGVIESFNRAAERIFGYAAEEVIGQNVKVLMPQPYRSEHDGYIENYRRTGVKKIIGIGREVEGLRKDGTRFPLDLAVSELQLGGQRLFVGLLRDLTESKRAQHDLEAALRFNEAVLTHVHEGIIVYDAELKVRTWNRFMQELTGRKLEEVLGKGLYEIFPTLRAYQPHLFIERALAGETLVSTEPLGRLRGTPEFLPPNSRADEIDDPRAAWTYTTWAPYRDQDGAISAVIVTVTDVTELIRSRDRALRLAQQARQLSAYLEKAREGERERIAREMHDELAGLLTGIKFDLNRMAESRSGDAQRIERLVGLTDAAIKSTRRIINDLRPPALDQLGLWSALEWLGAEIAARNDLRVTTEIAPEVEGLTLTPDTNISIYRIVQEALNNVAKHAAASKASIRAWRVGSELHIEVTDNGKGMDEAQRVKQGHWGLLGMNERAVSHSGEVRLESTPGRGTVVSVRLPIDRNAVD